ncbi:oxidoreductase-like protein [Russula compacta]|nr:oxidoreductase-like protein [Russula compacta]
MSGHRLSAIPSFLKHAAYTINAPRRPYTLLPSPIEHQKHSTRNGRNLSARFRSLEKALLAKHNLSQTIADAPKPLRLVLPSTPQQRPTVTTFKGLVIPEVPKALEPDECCMSGCAVCVHDLYQESLDDYNTSVAAVRASLTAMQVPVEEWPEIICPSSERRTSLSAPSISLSAFQEMERALKARRGAQAPS